MITGTDFYFQAKKQHSSNTNNYFRCNYIEFISITHNEAKSTALFMKEVIKIHFLIFKAINVS